MKKTVMVLLCAGLCTGCGSTASVPEDTPAAGYFTKDSAIESVKSEPLFDDWGRLLFPVQENYYSGDTLGDLQLTWYHNINPDKTVEIVNYMYDETEAGNQVFYDIYTDEEKAEDSAKKDTGFFLFKGKDNAKTAVLSAGGGFAYVGAMQDSFPAALELAKMGYNAVALIYRPGADTACEDLARTIAYLFAHEEELGIDMTDYSLWGGSAGARMAAWVSTDGTEAYGEKAYPRPATAVTQYTGLSEVTGREVPTYANVGTEDGIADCTVMEKRIQAIQDNGTDAMIEVFDGLEHGFGLGEGTAAEGWIDHAVDFWQKHMTTEDITETSDVNIPDSISAIPDAYFQPSDQPGTLEDLNYETYESFTYEDHRQKLTKHAVIYLPYGYDPEQRYDIFYLMHGGWSDENTALGTPDQPGSFKNVIDNAIENGEIRPLIIVCPTYNNTNENGRDSDDFGLAMQLTENYHNELLNDLMPAAEAKYSTYAESTDTAGFEASRDHRGFGGFSMGSVATWRTFAYCLDEFRYFLPMSCGTSLNDEEIWQAAEGHDPSEYYVFILTGTSDFAYGYEQDRHAKMEASEYFIDSDADPDGNFACRVKEGYSHDGTAAMEYTYNGLKAFFGE